MNSRANWKSFSWALNEINNLLFGKISGSLWSQNFVVKSECQNLTCSYCWCKCRKMCCNLVRWREGSFVQNVVRSFQLLELSVQCSNNGFWAVLGLLIVFLLVSLRTTYLLFLQNFSLALKAENRLKRNYCRRVWFQLQNIGRNFEGQNSCVVSYGKEQQCVWSALSEVCLTSGLPLIHFWLFVCVALHNRFFWCAKSFRHNWVLLWSHKHFQRKMRTKFTAEFCCVKFYRRGHLQHFTFVAVIVCCILGCNAVLHIRVICAWKTFVTYIPLGC